MYLIFLSFMTQGCLSDMYMLQMDVFNTFIELLRQTGNVTKGQIDANETRQVAFVFPSVKILPIYFFPLLILEALWDEGMWIMSK